MPDPRHPPFYRRRSGASWLPATLFQLGVVPQLCENHGKPLPQRAHLQRTISMRIRTSQILNRVEKLTGFSSRDSLVSGYQPALSRCLSASRLPSKSNFLSMNPTAPAVTPSACISLSEEIMYTGGRARPRAFHERRTFGPWSLERSRN